jgi:hypothetical protein
MNLFSPWTLLVTALFSAPVWWGTLDQALVVETAAGRTLAAWILAGVAVGWVGRLVEGYASRAAAEAAPAEADDEAQDPRRRVSDLPAADPSGSVLEQAEDAA